MVNRNNNNRARNGKGGGKGGNGPQRPQQRRAQPQFAQQNVVRARNPVPRGLPNNHHFNAFGPQKPQAMAFSIGPATHVGGLASSSETTSTSQPIMFIYQPSGGYSQLMRMDSTDGGATFSWPPSNTSIASTGIGSTPGVSSPAAVLCSRGSIRVRNTSRAADAGGVIRVLRLGTPLEFGGSDMGAVYTMVKNHPRTHTYTGSSLTMAHQWDCIPVDQASYSRFIDPVAGYDVLQHSTLGNLQATPAVSSVIFVFEPFAQIQNYEIAIAACYYARYRFTGPLASMASLPPHCPLARTNMLRDIAEAVGSAGRKVGTTLGNATLDRLVTGAEGFIGNLFRQNLNPGRLGGRWSTVSAIEEIPLSALTL